MRIEKLPSGSYRIRKMCDGKSYSIVIDHKPSQKEAIQLIAERMEHDRKRAPRTTFECSCKKYLELKENVLSPATIRGYSSILRNLSAEFKALDIYSISAVNVQKEINSYSVTHSPKSVRNAHGFITAVIAMFRPDFSATTTLPQKKKVESYIPSDEDVKKILARAKGTPYEAALILATFGLRRSEICALTLNDLEGNILTIDKALVNNNEGGYSLKTTKTTEGTRKIYIPDYLVALIHQSGTIYDRSPNRLYETLRDYQRELGLPRFRLHALRHYYASMSHSLGIPDSYIMASGGWKSDATLKTVYRHAMDSKKEEMQEFAATYITELINS